VFVCRRPFAIAPPVAAAKHASVRFYCTRVFSPPTMPIDSIRFGDDEARSFSVGAFRPPWQHGEFFAPLVILIASFVPSLLELLVWLDASLATNK